MEMSFAERPPLDPLVYEGIELAMYQVDQEHWPRIERMRVPNFIPPNVPIPPRLPQQLLGEIGLYATNLFKAEADHYDRFRDDRNYPIWLSRLEDRTHERVLSALEKIDSYGSKATLYYHGISREEISNGLTKLLFELRSYYTWQRNDKADTPVSSPPQPLHEPQTEKIVKRLPSTVTCPAVARKIEAYLNAKGVSQTDFASSAGTTDRTIRSFRRTGKIRRSLLPGIAKAMGVSKEDLLKS